MTYKRQNDDMSLKVEMTIKLFLTS